MESATRAELRFPDPSANPYLAFAAMVSAALDGIDNELPCPKPFNNVNVYHLSDEERQQYNIVQLPGSLREAMAELDADPVVKGSLGKEMYETFVRVKDSEWDEYRTAVTDWEVNRYLELA
jgi:glutamine synthetase